MRLRFMILTRFFSSIITVVTVATVRFSLSYFPDCNLGDSSTMSSYAWFLLLFLLHTYPILSIVTFLKEMQMKLDLDLRLIINSYMYILNIHNSGILALFTELLFGNWSGGSVTYFFLSTYLEEGWLLGWWV